MSKFNTYVLTAYFELEVNVEARLMKKFVWPDLLNCNEDRFVKITYFFRGTFTILRRTNNHARTTIMPRDRETKQRVDHVEARKDNIILY
jgi:hypothetical protein